MRLLTRFVAGILGLLVLALVLLFGGVGPITFLPGGWLWGELREPPADWSFTDAIAEIQLQTHVGPLPWSVTTWVFSEQGDLYVGANDCDRVWTHRVMADPEVRLRVDGAVYELRAEMVTNPAIAARLAPLTLHKYFGIAAESAEWIPGESPGCMFAMGPRS
jgi:hypothetical protein